MTEERGTDGLTDDERRRLKFDLPEEDACPGSNGERSSGKPRKSAKPSGAARRLPARTTEHPSKAGTEDSSTVRSEGNSSPVTDES